MNSDISGEPLEGSDDPVSVVVEFDDGKKKQLTVKAAEAAQLASAGQPASNWYSWQRVRPKIRTLAVFLLGAWFASIVIPALVAQWADRTKELELKKTLVTDISDSAAEVTMAAIIIDGQSSPEDLATRNAIAELKAVGPSPTPAEKKAITAAQAAVKKAKQAERRADQVAYNTARNKWFRTSASLKAQLDTYFTGTVASDWASYTRVVRDFLILSTDVSGKERRDLELNVQAFLARPDPVSAGTPFPDYELIADKLLDDRYLVLSQILSGNTRGYNTGKQDLLQRIFFVD
ncbi:MAG: hypothetical protein H0V71_11555 [Chloroflexi bacterium]|nr:hypothetical protein [Chloroflexota bacterium]